MTLFLLGFLCGFLAVIAIGAWQIHIQQEETIRALAQYIEESRAEITE